ncbi:tryptophan dimethylallyltransferase family protein [Lentzea sp. CC55]|uniref:tryptophan dimethylallyltransferase family protein n=1 Tax=Lentzea sp. CC55 TaxID=2884909 RepID=UPI0027DF5F64|nr:tryptophan dimethylallyltransferase family protein [Lentzea sp. CC55]
MSAPVPSLRDFAIGQLHDLLRAAGLAESAESAAKLLGEALGPGGGLPLSAVPHWPSSVADDHTPVEFSVALARNEHPVVRMIVEPLAGQPGKRANLGAALDVLDGLAARHQVRLGLLDRVRDLFLPEDPQGEFAFWYSLIVGREAAPGVKVYLNPDVRGRESATALVAEALARLGLDAALPSVSRNALRRDGLDRFSFFALDLTDESRARVKTYVSHEDAVIADVVRAAQAAPDVDPALLTDVCEIACGGDGPFSRRPLMSSYTFLSGDTDRPSGYSLYIPVRDYVQDDLEACERVLSIMVRCGFDPSPFFMALASLVRRPLGEGVGLIAHVSLRLGRPRPGVTVYLSSEAYAVTPPRTRALSA